MLQLLHLLALQRSHSCSVVFQNQSLLGLIKEAAFLEGDFTTRAGKKTTYYIDKYLFETRPDILDPLTDLMLTHFPPLTSFDRIAAPELGAVPLAAVLAIKAQKPFVIVKKASKDYGTQKLIEGKFNSGEKVVLVEDILTTAGAAINAFNELTRNKLSVVKLIGVIDREEGAAENVAKLDLPMSAVFTRTQLLAS